MENDPFGLVDSFLKLTLWMPYFEKMKCCTIFVKGSKQVKPFKTVGLQLSAMQYNSITFGTTKQTLYCFSLLYFESSKIKNSANTVLQAQSDT